ncbi:23S rRNA (pseudouridine(1915)-N(3))-methyltransferase RlmH [Albibacterium profundi]|uniref:Ribosomal RNA large subunit methyltransferase H n=1 Tax=Albibacterium profundi TaxID=3134906 RepID=A0ABV5CFA8_9SPHI
MKVSLICVGKTDEKYLIEGIENYLKRLKFYINFKLVIIPDIKNSKNLSQNQQKEKEAELILKHINGGDVVFLLDERGKEYRSIEFSSFLEKKMLASTQHLTFVIGGPYGFDTSVEQRSDGKLSLSKMTFSHQMIRLFFIEQLYRALSILKNEPYHHE